MNTSLKLVVLALCLVLGGCFYSSVGLIPAAYAIKPLDNRGRVSITFADSGATQEASYRWTGDSYEVETGDGSKKLYRFAPLTGDLMIVQATGEDTNFTYALAVKDGDEKINVLQYSCADLSEADRVKLHVKVSEDGGSCELSTYGQLREVMRRVAEKEPAIARTYEIID